MSPRSTNVKRTEARIERTFQASAERVFGAWTRPEALAEWAWAGIVKDVTAEVDLRVGGSFMIYGTAEKDHGWKSKEWGMCGVYVEIEPNRKLVHTLHFDGPVGYNQNTEEAVLDEAVIIEFADKGDTTDVVFRHIGIPDDGMSAPTHKQGVEASFKILDKILAR